MLLLWTSLTGDSFYLKQKLDTILEHTESILARIDLSQVWSFPKEQNRQILILLFVHWLIWEIWLPKTPNVIAHLFNKLTRGNVGIHTTCQYRSTQILTHKQETYLRIFLRWWLPIERKVISFIFNIPTRWDIREGCPKKVAVLLDFVQITSTPPGPAPPSP